MLPLPVAPVGTGTPSDSLNLEILEAPLKDRPLTAMRKTMCPSIQYSLSTCSRSGSQAGPWAIQMGS